MWNYTNQKIKSLKLHDISLPLTKLHVFGFTWQPLLLSLLRDGVTRVVAPAMSMKKSINLETIESILIDLKSCFHINGCGNELIELQVSPVYMLRDEHHFACCALLSLITIEIHFIE